jgi:signal transduction histidine kinase
MTSPISKDATITGMKPNSRLHLVKWGIVFGLTILYSVSIPLLSPIFGPIIAFVSIFPIIVAGLYFGMAGGITASVIAIIFNVFFLYDFRSGLWLITNQSGFLISAFILIFVGVSAGQMKLAYITRKQTETRLRERERFLSLLNDMTQTIIAAQDFDTMMHILVKDITILLKADTCYITRWDPAREQVIPVATNAEAGHPFLKATYPKREKNLTSSALEAGHVLIIEDTSNTELSTPHNMQMFSEKSFISIPLIYGEHKLGAAIVGCNEYGQFTQEKLEYAEQAADQIALAIWNAQRDFELKKRLHEVETLARISRALSETERIGLQTVLQLIVTSARELIPGAEQAVIHLLDQERKFLEAQAVSGYEYQVTNWKAIKIRPNEGVAGQVLVSGETINVADVEKDPRFVTYANPPKYRSLVVAPVQSGEQKLGTISVQSASISAFTEAESRLLSALGSQAATAIENAHLLESMQQALKESNALYRINQGLVASLDPQELLKDVVNLLQKNFGYYHVQVYILEPETGDFVIREGSGEIGRQLKEQGHRICAGEGIAGYTAETQEAFFTNNVDEVYFFSRNPLLPDTKSELAVPIKIDNQILGLLDIQQVPPAYLSQRDLQLVGAVSDQLAIALQKAKLYTDLQAALQVETAIRNEMVQSERLVTMGRLLASVSHELNNPLQAIQNALFLLREEKGISLQGKLDLDIVLSEAERMSTLIERLRTTYRPIQVEDFVPTQINSIIQDVYALISTHLRHNEIAFKFDPDPNLPLIPGLADQIRQVILNLLMNAVEAMTSGGELMVCTTLLPDTDEILLTVSDTGTGIPSELLPNIFDAFVTNKQRGTGLGLTISYDIVMKHRGRITAENNPDKGSTFKMWLPILNINGELQ